MFHLLKIRTSIDIFSTEKRKATFDLKYMLDLVGNPEDLFSHNEAHIVLLAARQDPVI